MAKIENLVPHILTWEVGLKKEHKNLNYEQMFESVRAKGYHCVKGDTGGPTMCGVTYATFAQWRAMHGKPKPSVEDLKNIDVEEWLAILESLFWHPCRANYIDNDSIALMLVDWRWVNGSQAIRDMQTAFGLVPDGSVGPKTLKELNSSPASVVFKRLKEARVMSYRRIVQRRPSQQKFLKGWLARTEAIEFKQ